MRSKMPGKLTVISIILTIVILVPLLPACGDPFPQATAYTAIIPSVLQSASKQAIAVALFSGDQPAQGKISLTLLQEGKTISRVQSNINGNGQIQLDIPQVAEGDYFIQVSGANFQDQAKVQIKNNFVVFMETDKPIYKPGQTINMRIMTLNSSLVPTTDSAIVSILDAKGIKIFRSEIKTDDYGMAQLSLPISSEPNLGTWKITAETAKSKTETDVRVEEYVLPKYEVKVDLPKNWFLVNEPIKGKVTATYSFGKPVKGDLEIKATKYVGTWQGYADIRLNFDSSAEFTVPAANYVAGVPAAQGNGNVKLEFIVTESATGYQEKTDNLVTVAQSSVNLSIIPSSSTFKPGLPYSFLIVSQTPDHNLVDTSVASRISYLGKDFKQIKSDDLKTNTTKGKNLVEINPPAGCVALTITCSGQNVYATKSIEAVYSPSANFIHVEQTSEGTPQAGENVKFWVYSTKEATNFYYEVISRGQVVFSNYVRGSEISFQTTPAMAPSAKLLVYQILPNAELAADYLPFNVTAQYPQTIKLDTGVVQAKPGDNLNINIKTEGQAEVGIAAVDKSVYILAENRMNLQQVFDAIEKLYMNPQAELHEVNIYNGIQNKGAKEIFQDAGVIMLSNKTVPEGKKYSAPVRNGGIMAGGPPGMEKAVGAAPPMAAPAPAPPTTAAGLDTSGRQSGLAEVQRVRQFFPETWIWNTVKTDTNGNASLKVTVPDSITTWMLRAVALSKTRGLGITESQLKVFQPFFLSIDLPYSAIRGEEFPVSVAVYNYLDQSQSVTVEIQKENWFDLLDNSQKTIDIKANEIGSAKFRIRPALLGNAHPVKITARSTQAADAVVKTLIVEPEGVARETVDNITLANGKTSVMSTMFPAGVVEGSPRAYLAVTSSYLSQTLKGLDSLIQMPFGCGEQNMIIFAPDVFITKYLQESGQLKPEIMAKAEKLMLTGYQRELTYRRNDNSFSAFGQNDKEGSLWLTAFVLKSFSQAKGLIYIDDQVLNSAQSWILAHQNTDGSFDSFGFVIHKEMTGGLQGKTALTAYVTIALLEAGEKNGSAKAVNYLENQLDKTDDPYALALISYTLELAKSGKAGLAHDKLMKLAKADDNGLHWGADQIVAPVSGAPMKIMPVQSTPSTSAIETTAYATLALIKHGDVINASQSAKWLVSKRNSAGGFGSTQDTVMGLQALIEQARGAKSDVDLTLTITSSGKSQDLTINAQNSDVLQIIELPINGDVKISSKGRGEAVGQIVRRYNTPQVIQEKTDILKVNVNYNADSVAVNDKVKVSVDVSFNPPTPMEAGMVVVDVSVPTGFAAEKDSIDKIIAQQKNIKRYDISGRKVIFYVENMLPGDKISFDFLVKAMYPVKAKAVASQAYSYYQPEIISEAAGHDITVVEK
jgi:CD109 antigen